MLTDERLAEIAKEAGWGYITVPSVALELVNEIVRLRQTVRSWESGAPETCLAGCGYPVSMCACPDVEWDRAVGGAGAVT